MELSFFYIYLYVGVVGPYATCLSGFMCMGMSMGISMAMK